MKLGSFKVSSVKVRLAIWIIGVQTLVLLGLGTTVQYVTHANLLASIDREMGERARLHPPSPRRIQTLGKSEGRPGGPPPQGMMPQQPPSGPGPRMDTGEPQASKNAFILYRPRILDLQGHGVGRSATKGPWDESTFARSKNGKALYSTITFENEPVRVLSEPIRADGKIVGVIQIAHSLAEMNRDLLGLFQTLLMLIPLALLVTGFSSAFLMGRLIRPVREIRCAAESIGAEDLSRRLPISGNDEFSRLSITFNAMLSRLERAFERQRRFTADASHELKTPLTVIKANTSLALLGKKSPEQYASHMQAVDRAANLMSHIIQDLLLLARSDAGQLEFAMEPVSVRSILASAMEQVEGSGETPIEISPDAGELMVFGDSAQLIRLFMNLLDNARRHTPSDGSIVVKSEGDGKWVAIEVRDTGEGIPEEHLPHVCERFYRVDASRTRQRGGTGLGLAITKSIASAHGGNFAIDSVRGMGTVARVTLPQASAGNQRV